jgi:hypothetical protein
LGVETRSPWCYPKGTEISEKQLSDVSPTCGLRAERSRPEDGALSTDRPASLGPAAWHRHSEQSLRHVRRASGPRIAGRHFREVARPIRTGLCGGWPAWVSVYSKFTCSSLASTSVKPHWRKPYPRLYFAGGPANSTVPIVEVCRDWSGPIPMAPLIEMARRPVASALCSARQLLWQGTGNTAGPT